jgi:dipeptidyl-peptidase-4
VDEERYPKAGDQNPTVRLGVVSAGGGKVKWITPTDEADIYIPRFGWMRDGWVWAEVMNRAQEKMDLYFIDAHSGKARKVLTESSPDAWVNVNDDFKILKSGDRFLWSSWRDGHTHLFLYSFPKEEPLLADAKLERQLEQGDYEVIQLEGVDDPASMVFFTANKGDPRQQRLFSVKLDGSAVALVSSGEGTYDANFSDDGKHYVETYSSVSSSPKMSVCVAGGACSPFWQARSVADYRLGEWKFMQLQANDGTVLYGKLLMPPNAAPGAKIPLIVNIYGGPAAQLVTNSWGGGTQLFDELLARDGFALFSVDNRGTPNRGRKFSAAIRRQFGGIELKDQMAALNSLYEQYPQLDHDRTGMWGWSNGASMTLYTLTHSTAFKAGIAVAPVTSWRNYDSIYTERYMGLPKDDPQGYADSDIPKVAKDLHGALLLVHGTSDDNVHFQNTIQMVNAFINADKHFQLMVYPNKTHGIAGPAARTHLFEMMQEHWDKELK